MLLFRRVSCSAPKKLLLPTHISSSCCSISSIYVAIIIQQHARQTYKNKNEQRATGTLVLVFSVPTARTRTGGTPVHECTSCFVFCYTNRVSHSSTQLCLFDFRSNFVPGVPIYMYHTGAQLCPAPSASFRF